MPEPAMEPLSDSRWRVTLRGNAYEIRGYVDGRDELRALADAVKLLGILVLASPETPDYYPWSDDG